MTEIIDYEPVITRKNISIFELVRVITDLANYLYELKDINKYIDDLELDEIVDPVNLAFLLLQSGKFDAIINRGCEYVTYSKLKKNKTTLMLIEDYLNNQREEYNNLFSTLGLNENNNVNVELIENK